MFARVITGSLNGLDAYKIDVEVDVGSGIGQILIVGLPDTAVKESQERVRSAIKACQFIMPPGKKWVVNLAPCDLRKAGPAFDVPIAAGILAATQSISTENLAYFWLVGELGLDGSVRPVSGVLPIVLQAAASGAKAVIIPDANAEEASLVEGIDIYPVSHLKQVCTILNNPKAGSVLASNAREIFQRTQNNFSFGSDFADVKGQERAKRALEIAAAGRHNILMVGPPGSGKSMLASRLPTIMPPLEFAEALELTKLYSVAGLLTNKATLVFERPFRSPHHSASSSGLVGGGSHPKPGEISLSHMGILFLDELTEFPKSHLETLRQPLESGNVTISRAQQSLTYPASFLLVGACNPCPCGHRGDPSRYCACSPNQAERYWARLSGPFLDRIDLQIQVSRLGESELASGLRSETSESIKLRVMRAVHRQKSRFEQDRCTFNGQLAHKQLAKFCRIDEGLRTMLARAISQLGLSARAYDRILRIARTIADLDGEDDIGKKQIAEALALRNLRSPNAL